MEIDNSERVDIKVSWLLTFVVKIVEMRSVEILHGAAAAFMNAKWHYILLLLLVGGCMSVQHGSRYEISSKVADVRSYLKHQFRYNNFLVSEEEDGLAIESFPYPGPKRGFGIFKHQWEEKICLSLVLREQPRLNFGGRTNEILFLTVGSESWKILQRQNPSFTWIEVADSPSALPVMQRIRSIILEAQTKYENRDR